MEEFFVSPLSYLQSDTLKFILSLILIFFSITCGVSANSQLFPVVITDDLGNTITIQKQPTRIISLSPSNTEIAFAVGASSQIVGVTDFCDYPSDTANLPKVGGFSTVDIEHVISLDPDLVLASDQTGEGVLEKLASYGIHYLVLHPDSFEDIYGNIKLIGEASGHCEKADALIMNMKKRVEQVEQDAKTFPFSPKVTHVIWKDPLMISGTDTFHNTLIHLAGGTQAFLEVTGWSTVSLEEFIATDPEVILVNSGDGMAGINDSLYNYFITEPRLSGLSAVRNGNVFEVESDLVDRAGPRSIEALEMIAEKLSHVSTFDI